MIEDEDYPFTYLASPYSSKLPQIMQVRYEEARRATAYLLKQHHWTYSPIVHCHDIASVHSLPTDFDFWQHYNRVMLFHAKRMAILAIDGWEKSTGVAGEIKFAQECGTPIVLLCPHGTEYIWMAHANN